jgi:amino acid transporter
MSDQSEKAILDEDMKVLHGMGYAQELSRRMHGFSNFAISFSIICILAGGITSFNVGFSTGGAFMVTVGWTIGGLFALVVAASLGQIASAYPTAGGLYHWSSILGGRGWGWVTAWINLLGLIFVVASVNVGVYTLFRDLVLGPITGMDVSGFGVTHQIVAIVLISVTQGLFNHFGIKVTTTLTDFSGYLILVVAVLLTAVFLIYGAHHFDIAGLFRFDNYTGLPVVSTVDGKEVAGDPWTPKAGIVTAFLIGILYPLYTITGFDASAHTSEETVDARRAVPRGMLHSVFWSLVFGLFLAFSFVTAIPDWAAAAKDGPGVWFNLFNGLPCPNWMRNLLAIGIVVSNYLCALAGVTSTSRMIYAFARDGGLPGSNLWKQVSAAFRTPVPAIWLTVALSIAATLYSPAFSALAAGCALFLYISYAMPVAAGLLAEGGSWTTFGPFRLGGLSKPFAVLVIIGVLLLAYGGIQPPNDILINYALGLLVLLLVLWFGIESRRFKGPPVGEAIARKQAEIAAAEKALAQAG